MPTIARTSSAGRVRTSLVRTLVPYGSIQSKIVLPLLAVILAASAGGVTAAGAVTPTEALFESNAAAVLVETHPDLIEYMELYNVDAVSAAAQLNDTGALADLQDAFEVAMPTQFAGLWIDHEPYGATIALSERSGKIDWRQVFALIDRRVLSVLPDTKVVDRSLLDLQAIMDALDDNPVPHNTFVDVRTNTVVVEVLSAAEFNAQQDQGEGPFVVREVGGLGEPTRDMLGGMTQTAFPTLDAGGCTLGFTVVNYDIIPNRKGFLTAGHCPNNVSLDAWGQPIRAEAWHRAWDVQLHDTRGHTNKPRFIVARDGTWRDTLGLKNSVVGQLICKFGDRTGKTCGEVETINLSPNWKEGSCCYVRAYNCNITMSGGGDSGGPVFLNRNAYGLVAGQMPFACSMFGPAMLVY